MNFTKLEIPGAYLIESDQIADERGSFSRVYCSAEAEKHGLLAVGTQVNRSWNPQRGTLRGLHYLLPPCREAKAIICVRGSVFDVLLDLRPESPAFGRHVAFTLRADNRQWLYCPPTCAHGFLTLTDDSELIYLMSCAYNPVRERGVRWNDKYFNIPWPEIPRCMSAKDRMYPDFDPAYHLEGLIHREQGGVP